MAAPASRFRPSRADAASSLLTGEPAAVLPQQPTTPVIETMTRPIQRPVSLGAIEFDREVPPCGHFALFHGGQDIWVGPAFAGRTITVWADDRSIHVTIEGYLLKTFASRTSLEDLARIRDKFSGRPAGPPPAAPALPRHRGRPQLPPGTAVEVERAVTRDGVVGLGDRDVMLSRTLAGSRVVLRMDEHLLHVIRGGRVVKTMPLPIPPGRLPLLKGVRAATDALPPSGPIGPVTVQRLVNGNGRVMVAGQYMRIGAVHSGKVVNVIVEATHFRIVYNGEELAVHPRTSDKPVTRVKAWPSRQSRTPRQTSHEDAASSKS
ncbi:helix-turn-helix domain-containing protein [Streptomyces sp. NPDC000878]